MKRKIYILTFLFLVSVVCVYPQKSITIDEYGIYFINEGEAVKLPIEDRVASPAFWRNYIIFSFGYMIVYNIDNGAISDVLHSGRALGGFFPIENKNILMYVYGNEYELDPVTLQTLNSRINTTRTFKERPIDFERKYDFPDLIYIDEKYRRFRLQGVNFYLDVTLTDNIDTLKIQEIHGGTLNQFLLIIDDRYNGEH